MEDSTTYKKRDENNFVERINTYVRYGKEDCAEKFLEITKIKDRDERNKRIDAFLEEIENRADKNGFFRHDEKIHANFGFGDYGFKIDDKELYYMFFDRYIELREKYPKAPNGAVHENAVKQVIDSYLGSFKGNYELRDELLLPDNYIEDRINQNINNVRSISAFRGRNCALCVENASIAHNLWILGGYECSYVAAGDANLTGEPEPHAYCIVTQIPHLKYLLFDKTNNIYKSMPTKKNPRENILEGNGLSVTIENEVLVYSASHNEDTSSDENEEEQTMLI